jgi:putative oxidoreductase
MTRVLAPYADRIYALFRIVVGFLFLCHGLQKLFGLFGAAGQQPPLASMGGAAGIIETVTGTLVLIGFLTGWAAFLASGTMAVAYFMVHQPQGALPIENHGELAAVYSFVFLFIAARGSGPWSVDEAMGSGRAG